MTKVLYALLFLPALLAIVFVLVRSAAGARARGSGSRAGDDLGRPRPDGGARRTARGARGSDGAIGGADELDEHAVVELERLADRFEAAAASLERVG